MIFIIEPCITHLKILFTYQGLGQSIVFSYDDTMMLLLNQKMLAKVSYENDHSFWLARFCLARAGSKRKLVSVFSRSEKLFLIGKPTTRISEEQELAPDYCGLS